MSNASYQTIIPHLSKLQQIDSELDQIQQQKGVLPKMVADLSYETEGLKAQQKNAEEKKIEYSEIIVQQREKIKETESLIDKYNEELKNTQNDRQYEVISEDLEVQKIEVKLLKRRILEAKQQIQDQNQLIEQVNGTIESKQKMLETHQKSLEAIEEKTATLEQKLNKERPKVIASIPKTLFAHYEKIRTIEHDAVVDVVENACNGCYIIVRAQQQLNVKAQQHLQTCDNCGRILIQVIKPPEKEPKRRTRRTTRKRGETTAIASAS